MKYLRRQVWQLDDWNMDMNPGAFSRGLCGQETILSPFPIVNWLPKPRAKPLQSVLGFFFWLLDRTPNDIKRQCSGLRGRKQSALTSKPAQPDLHRYWQERVNGKQRLGHDTVTRKNEDDPSGVVGMNESHKHPSQNVGRFPCMACSMY